MNLKKKNYQTKIYELANKLMYVYNQVYNPR